MALPSPTHMTTPQRQRSGTGPKPARPDNPAHRRRVGPLKRLGHTGVFEWLDSMENPMEHDAIPYVAPDDRLMDTVRWELACYRTSIGRTEALSTASHIWHKSHEGA